MYKIQDLRDRRERPGTAVEQIQGRDRLKIRKDRIDPRDPEYAGIDGGSVNYEKNCMCNAMYSACI